MSDDAARMNRFSLRFAETGLEASFAEEQAHKAQRPVRTVALWAGGIILVFWALAGATLPRIPNAHAHIAVPMIVLLGTLALGYAFINTPRVLRHQQLFLMTGMCLGSAAIVGLASLTPRATFLGVGYLMVVLHTFNIYALVRLRFPSAVACAWLTAAMYVGYLGATGALTGRAFWDHAIALGMANAFGMLVGYQLELHLRREYVAMRDLKLAELELRRARDQAVAATLAKSQFLANMSHELRTPLNAINGFSEVLIERMFGELNEKQADYVKDIHSSGKHLLSLINDILDLSKVEAGRMELDVTTFHLPSAIDNAITLIRERAGRHGIALECNIDPSLGEFGGDERKFKQIMLNLLSNAIKFTPEGGRIAVTAGAQNRLVEVAIADTGAGIAPDDLPLMFEEFRQVGTDHAKKAEGTGLGLALTKRFIELHGGSIRVESTLGKGSTFILTLAEQSLTGTNV
ncbi:MAG: ATP-binding protein [Pseudomonadota bacterium]